LGIRINSRLFGAIFAISLILSISSVYTISAATITEFDDLATWEAQLSSPQSLRTIDFEEFTAGPVTSPLVIDGIVTITDPLGMTIVDDNGVKSLLLNKDATIDFDPAGVGGVGITDSFVHDQGNGITAFDGDGDKDKARGFKSPGTQIFIGFDSPAGIVQLIIGKGSTPAIGIDTLHFEFNFPPDAVDDAPVFTEDDGDTAIDVLANDSDPDGDPLDITSFDTSGITKGVITVDTTTDTVSYNPDGAFEALDTGDVDTTQTFTYTLTDDDGASDTATVTINISGVNDPPVAFDDGPFLMAVNNAQHSETLTVPDKGVLENDSDIDDTLLELSANVVQTDDSGTISNLVPGDALGVGDNFSGGFIFQPASEFEGIWEFVYRAFDSEDESVDPATVTIQVIRPVITTDKLSYTSSENTNEQIVITVDDISDTGDGTVTVNVSTPSDSENVVLDELALANPGIFDNSLSPLIICEVGADNCQEASKLQTPPIEIVYSWASVYVSC